MNKKIIFLVLLTAIITAGFFYWNPRKTSIPGIYITTKGKIEIIAENGKRKVYQNSPEGKTPDMTFDYKGLFLNAYYEIDYSCWLGEGGSKLLISKKTGDEYDLPPHETLYVSPGKKYFASAEGNEAFVFSGVQIYRIEPDRLVQEFSKEISGFDGKGWAMDEVFEIQHWNLPQYGSGKTQFIRKIKNQWEIQDSTSSL